ncbi:hypothetical protein BS47DRAFT_1370105, partial [Hydnum rufescens UP504]
MVKATPPVPHTCPSGCVVLLGSKPEHPKQQPTPTATRPMVKAMPPVPHTCPSGIQAGAPKMTTHPNSNPPNGEGHAPVPHTRPSSGCVWCELEVWLLGLYLICTLRFGPGTFENPEIICMGLTFTIGQTCKEVKASIACNQEKKDLLEAYKAEVEKASLAGTPKPSIRAFTQKHGKG